MSIEATLLEDLERIVSEYPGGKMGTMPVSDDLGTDQVVVDNIVALRVDHQEKVLRVNEGSDQGGWDIPLKYGYLVLNQDEAVIVEDRSKFWVLSSLKAPKGPVDVFELIRRGLFEKGLFEREEE